MASVSGRKELKYFPTRHLTKIDGERLMKLHIRENATVEVCLPQWQSCNKKNSTIYEIPYLEPGHYLSVVAGSDYCWYIFAQGQSTIADYALKCTRLSDLREHPDSQDATILYINSDGTWTAQADRFGFYPLYYMENDRTSRNRTKLWFDLQQAGAEIRQPSQEYCAIFLAGLNQTFPFDTHTMWQDLLCLPPGYKICGDVHGALHFERCTVSPEANVHISDLTEIFSHQVSERADFLRQLSPRISCDLSGGLDSSYTAVTMAQRTKYLQTVFLDNGIANISDADWARHIAKNIGSDHKTIDYVSNSNVLSQPESTISSQMKFGFDESFRYITLAPRLANMCESFGASLHLNGHGGDELVGPNSAMAWSYYRSPHSPYVQRFRNALGFAKANKFPISQFIKTIRSEGTLHEELATGIKILPEQYNVSDKYDSSWIPAVTLPPFCNDSLRPFLNQLSHDLATKFTEPYAPDRSQHRIAEDVIAHVRLLRALNMMDMPARCTFASLFLSPQVISQAMSLRIEDRFMARTIKPLLYRTWPQNLSSDVFRRHDKGEYSAATFDEFHSEKSRIRSLLGPSSILSDMGLLDNQLVTHTIDGFSADGFSLDALIRAASLESWLSER
ncbi:hypothetical protein JTE88_03645 [Arcanobacterium phocisimile]|uniref:Asparagine synthetase domain-containing protein n=1 Tax=Arcanobacterium phocisimile TaxID=1302235 RepID=A0ABX7IJX0_9ACTO|nr:asparagine synthase-related protein [Arcanobacterium phocisimile]QRV02829.1 hypothetical protein JTE88_03645 [Arcanobacterium phocisimile]